MGARHSRNVSPDIMIDSPSEIAKEQLEELSLEIAAKATIANGGA